MLLRFQEKVIFFFFDNSRTYFYINSFFSFDILKLFHDIMFADFERYIFINERETKSRIIVIGAKHVQTIK